MTKIIRKDVFNKSDKKLTELSRVRALNKHLISSRAITLPSVAMSRGINGPQILAYTDDENVANNGVEAVKQRIDIVVGPNGEIVSPCGGPICFGMQYDRYVTVLHFDLSALNWEKSTDANYLFRLAFFNEENEQMPFYFEGGQIQLIDLDVPMVYEFDGEDFFVPREITATPGKYGVVLIIQEKLSDDVEGNVVDQSEIFISSPIKGFIKESLYKPSISIVDNEIEVKKTSLAKKDIPVIIADDGTMAVGNNILGNNFDSYMKNFNLVRVTSHISNFDVYAIFFKDGKFFYSKADMKKKRCPIPNNVTHQPGNWTIIFIAFKGDYNNPDYFFITSSVEMKVLDNFLNEDIFSSNANINSSLYSNFITADDLLIITSDGETFFWDEY